MATGSETFGAFLTSDTNTLALPLPVLGTDRVAVVRGGATYYASPSGLTRTYQYVVAAEGGTTVAAAGLGALVLDPAAPLTNYTIDLPPTPSDGQIFDVSTSQNITNFTATATGGITVSGGGPGALGVGASWRYVQAKLTWYRRY